jgi:hypothetical protein
MLWLDQVAADLPAKLTRLIDDALAADDGLEQRALRLAADVSHKTSALLHEADVLARAA